MLNSKPVLGNFATRWNKVRKQGSSIVISRARGIFYSSCLCLIYTAIFPFFLFFLSKDVFWLHVMYWLLSVGFIVIIVFVCRENYIVINGDEGQIVIYMKKSFISNKIKTPLSDVVVLLSKKPKIVSKDEESFCLSLNLTKSDLLIDIARSKKYVYILPILRAFEESGCKVMKN